LAFALTWAVAVGIANSELAEVPAATILWVTYITTRIGGREALQSVLRTGGTSGNTYRAVDLDQSSEDGMFKLCSFHSSP
jgi:hypothetical protein